MIRWGSGLGVSVFLICEQSCCSPLTPARKAGEATPQVRKVFPQLGITPPIAGWGPNAGARSTYHQAVSAPYLERARAGWTEGGRVGNEGGGGDRNGEEGWGDPKGRAVVVVIKVIGMPQ